MNEICMISLDTSTIDTGYAIWKNGVLLRYGNICLSNINDTKQRIDTMIKEIHNLILKEKANIIIPEGLTVFNDIKSDSNLSEIIGACRGFSIIYQAWFDKLFPHEWRHLIAKEDEKIPMKRDDCKIWDIAKVKEIFGIELDNDNIADAILIGYAYYLLFNENNKDCVFIN